MQSMLITSKCPKLSTKNRTKSIFIIKNFFVINNFYFLLQIGYLLCVLVCFYTACGKKDNKQTQHKYKPSYNS